MPTDTARPDVARLDPYAFLAVLGKRVRGAFLKGRGRSSLPWLGSCVRFFWVPGAGAGRRR
jgi:hypothetical protein